MASLRSIILIVRNVEASVAFYEKLGLPILACLPDDWALLGTGQANSQQGPSEDAVTIQLKQVSDSEASHNAGYSPVLSYRVADLDTLVPELLMQGANLDGAIKYSPTGKVAHLRTPHNCGSHMISLVEPNEDSQPGPGQQLR